MRTVGIVCECNPFHAGHAYLIDSARRAGAETVVCVMSGCFVQRGEGAIADPYLRAKALVLGGADLVLELPFPYSAAGAEQFAAAGVKMLDALGVDELWFGSECGDLDRLSRVALVCDDPRFVEQYRQSAVGDTGTAEAYFSCLRSFLGADADCFSNDILAISYLRALRAIGSKVRPVTVRREGGAYLDDTLGDGFPSATALRRKWREEGADAVLPYLPEATRELWRGVVPADLRNAERLILGYFRLTSPEVLESCAALSGGLGNRLSRAAQSARSYDELMSLAATKKYPTSRLQRGILFGLLQVGDADLANDPAYARLLAANRAGCEYLAWARKRSGLTVITRKSDLPDTPEALRQEAWETRAFALYTLCTPESGAADALWRRSAYIHEG